MRGKEQVIRNCRVNGGITPAYAGKRIFCRFCAVVVQDHPRICGEKTSSRVTNLSHSGSPPHMRGKAGHGVEGGQHLGITPAYAGKRNQPSRSGRCCRDHPRICGEKIVRKATIDPNLGSPPHMRGKADIAPVLPCGLGITPAYAGKSYKRTNESRCTKDHPRICGEKPVCFF